MGILGEIRMSAGVMAMLMLTKVSVRLRGELGELRSYPAKDALSIR